jgi:hypothetical protein
LLSRKVSKPLSREIPAPEKTIIFINTPRELTDWTPVDL